MTALRNPASEKADDSVSKKHLRLWLHMLKATRVIQNELREKLRIEFATTLPRFDVMSALSRHADGMQMSALSAALKVSNGNVTGIVDRLVKEGYALRKQVPSDRRAASVMLTLRGRDEFSLQAHAHEAWLNDLLSDLKIDETQQLSMLLNRVTDAIQEKRA
jgi:DNA-binding MarR family transcriptional regulator